MMATSVGVGLEIPNAAVPLAPGVAEAAALLGRDPLDLALGGGEDFVLAAACPAPPTWAASSTAAASPPPRASASA
jgi:thiamine monophosphate kinase